MALVKAWRSNTKAFEKAMLVRYSSVIDDAARAALQDLLADLKQDLIDLQNELASLMANFGEQADSVADLLTGEARQDGFGPDDHWRRLFVRE